MHVVVWIVCISILPVVAFTNSEDTSEDCQKKQVIARIAEYSEGNSEMNTAPLTLLRGMISQP